ncbi:hypothetical protein EIP86_004859 [Pleurotus ostreatoroseus]|nr:hypothetical protein EIP86_004859 [Pleurotus ostreatoroseus]
MRPVTTLLHFLRIRSTAKDDHHRPLTTRAAPASPARTPLIPELVDMIIDELQDDKAALSACSLVARGWYNRSRYHLFRSVTVRTTSRFKAFLAFLAKSPAREHIRVLRLGNERGTDRKIKLRIGPATIAAVLAALPALETVGVYYASWNPNQKDKFLIPNAWTYTPHHIDSFELVEVVNERRRGMVGGTPLTLDDIRACLRSLPSVGTLTITHARWRDDELTTEPEPALPVEPLAALRVHKLSLLSHSMLPSMLPLISMTSSASTMTKLMVGMSEWEGVVALGELLAKDFGPRLSELSLVFACVCRFLPGEIDSLWRTLCLGRCTELRAFGYWVFMFSNNPRSSRLYWEALLALLREGVAGPLAKLERIKFNICMAGETKWLQRQLTEVGWGQLEALLCRYPRLRTVEFVTEHRGSRVRDGEDMAWREIAGSLPLLAKKGYLRRGSK